MWIWSGLAIKLELSQGTLTGDLGPQSSGSIVVSALNSRRLCWRQSNNFLNWFRKVCPSAARKSPLWWLEDNRPIVPFPGTTRKAIRHNLVQLKGPLGRSSRLDFHKIHRSPISVWDRLYHSKTYFGDCNLFTNLHILFRFSSAT